MPTRKVFLKIVFVSILALSSSWGGIQSVSSHPDLKTIGSVEAESIFQASGTVPLLADIARDGPSSRVYLPLVDNLYNMTNTYKVFLPILNNVFAYETVFGIEMGQITNSNGVNQMKAENATWVRRNGVLWADVEPNEGDRNWTALAELDQELITASSNGLQVILIVRKTPAWAQKVEDSLCGPIREDKLMAFGNFMYDLVSRYSALPYNVKYWELWNEPDVDPALAKYVGGNNIPFGCWGDSTQTYYGGEYYAEMLKVVYPRIKSADPMSQVLVGGLLLDCDPRGSPSVCASYGHSDTPPRFLEGILRNGGGDYFDGVGFHVYDGYWGTLGHYGVVTWSSLWKSTGPAMIAKDRFIREVLAAYNVSGKFIINSEVALVCGYSNDPPGQHPCEADPNSSFEQTKAYYGTELYAASIAEGLRAIVWYSVLGWRNSGLLNSDLSPRPVYTAIQIAQRDLSGASWVRDVTEYEGVKGYEFQRGDRRIWVVWSLDGSTHTINLPEVPEAAWDVFGNLEIPSVLMDVDLKPLYLEW